MDIKPIETQYKGYRFRSRLEARWAVFFDALGVEWEYEKEGFDLPNGDRYLPDFWLPLYTVWVEIKGECDETGKTKAEILANHLGHPVIIAEGSIGSHKWIEYGIDPNEPYWIYRIKRFKQPLAMFLGAGPGNDAPEDWGQRITCPVCGCENVYFCLRDKKFPDQKETWQGSGKAIRFSMNCERNHYWVFRLGTHEGCTYSSIDDVWGTADNIGLCLARGNKEVYEAAINRAKSARFEFGEEG